jgi:aminopeptidase N
VPKYAAGRAWYPVGRDGGGLHDSHTARLELVTDDRYDLQAMGALVDEREADHRKMTVWEVAQPVKMVTFTMQKDLYAEDVEHEGIPPLTVAGDIGDPDNGLNEERISLVGVDTANAIDYLQQLLAMPLPDTHFYAVLIPSSHGQAFEGFLHLGGFTALLDTPAAVERFRAHEAAHQWWGHIVGWNSYRDQWLSEGFAEYMALMFVHDTVDKGPKIFQEAITAYSNEVQGSIKTAFSKFARPGLALLTARGAERVGPIGHGWRAAIGETPTAYQTLTYTKGALVLHMLRTMTAQMTGSGDAFVAILRDFVATNAGGDPTTEDFRAAVERQVPADWSWFFDQWLYGAEIPTYAWDYEIVPGAGGGSILRLTVEQRGVSPGFRMLVPVEVEFAKNQTRRLAVFVDQPLETFELELPKRPRKVTFNPGDAVLASVKKR